VYFLQYLIIRSSSIILIVICYGYSTCLLSLCCVSFALSFLVPNVIIYWVTYVLKHAHRDAPIWSVHERQVLWCESTRGYCNFSSTHVEERRCRWCLVAFPRAGTYLRTAMHHAFTTGLQATNRKHKCTLLRLVFLCEIFLNREVCETWERNCILGYD
jgi:hypothetical protein